MENLLPAISRWFQEEGLVFLGAAPLTEEPDFSAFSHWLREGKHAGMEFMTRHQNLRREPQNILPGGKSALVFALNYNQGDQFNLNEWGGPRIAQYGRIRDYHKTMRAAGETVLRQLTAVTSPATTGRVTVDSAPILERALATRTGAGFIGKNSCFITPEQGSFLLLGEILTTIPWERFQPIGSPKSLPSCGSCRRCQAFCPTEAINSEYKIDASRCLAYWTIEHRGTIPDEFWPYMNRHVFGCDLCQLVCPHNQATTISTSALAKPRVPMAPDLATVATMDQTTYESLFAGTPVTRAKRTGLRRNALIAAYAIGDPRLSGIISQVMTDSQLDPVLLATVEKINSKRL